MEAKDGFFLIGPNSPPPPDVAQHQENEESSPCEEEYYSYLHEKLTRCPYSLDELTYHSTQGLFY